MSKGDHIEMTEKRLPRVKLELCNVIEMRFPDLGRKHQGFVRRIEPGRDGEWIITFQQTFAGDDE